MAQILNQLRLSPPITLIRNLLPNPLVNTLYHFPIALAAVIFYRYPARNFTTIGITGTDGKTTTSHLIYQILKTANIQVALISTVSAKFDNQNIDTGFHVTSPHPFKLQKLLRQLANRGATHLVLEATSHGLDQHRLLGCHFHTGVLTNLTHEHLDYHQTLDRYFKSKAKLFRHTRFAILNADDPSLSKFKKTIKKKNPSCQILTYSLKKKSDLRAKDIFYHPHHTDFTLKVNPQLKKIVPPHLKFILKLKLNLPGSYNISNALAAIGATLTLQPTPHFPETLRSLPPIPGRLETIPTKNGITIIIDFAHTPNALKQMLQNVRQNLLPKTGHSQTQKSNRLITVFGCAGLRDSSKRPLMGKISAQLSNFTILTAEDPRTENVNRIIDQIAVGCLKTGAQELKANTPLSNNLPQKPITKKQSPASFFLRIPDRQQAINFAIQKLAKKGDVIIICGKGHEKSMCFGTTELPWSDHSAVRNALKNIKN